MKDGMLLFISVVGVLGLILTPPVWAETRQGKVVEVSPDKLIMMDTAGENQHTYEVATDAAILRAGKFCGLTDIQAGDTVTVVTAQREDKIVATKVQANKLEVTPLRSCKPSGRKKSGG